MAILQLIRWKNLLIILFTEVVIKYGLMDYYFSKMEFSYRMSPLLFWTLVFSSLFIAAGGYLLNDIQDVEIDRVHKSNRPLVSEAISKKTASILMYTFNIVGIISSLYAAFIIQKMGLATVQLFVMALLFGYSNFFKCSKLIGNLLVSITTAMVPFLIWIYTIYDVLAQGFMFSYDLRWMHISVMFFILFAFLSTLIRELIKDKEDAEEDLTYGCKTWAATISLRKLKYSVLFLFILLSVLIGVYQFYLPFTLFFRISFVIIHLIIFVIAIPLLYRARRREDFHQLSSLIKIIMIIGIASPVILWI